MRQIFVCSASALVLTWAATAAADAPRLKGQYAFTGTMACLFAPGSIPGATAPLPNPTPGTALPNSGFQINTSCTTSAPCHDLQPIDGNTFSNSTAVEGIRTFNDDGTGTVKGSEVGISVPPTPGPNGYPHFPPSADASSFAYSFTYTVNGDGSWSADVVPGTFTVSFTRGPRSGQTATVANFPTVTGMISANGQTLMLATLEPTVETITFSNGDVWPRICHRSRVLIKLQQDRDDDHGGDHRN